MDIRIEYCVQWNYKPRARSLRQELSDTFGYWAELKPGERGAFEVYVNGNLIFSKLKEDRFPNEGEIVLWIKNLVICLGSSLFYLGCGLL